jgi:mycofactocin precursor peptide peptidase
MNSSVTTIDVGDHQPIVVIPVGSWEQHGPHLPFDTDTRIAMAVINHSLPVDDLSAVFVAPAITITASDEHAGFPGTLSIGTEAFAASAIGVAKSATWSRGVLFVNGHGGNADAFRIVTKDLARNNIPHSIWSPPYDTTDDMHAGKTETSLLMHLAPELVHTSRLTAGNTANITELIDDMKVGGVRQVSPNGILGDATAATAQHGSELFANYCASLRALFTELQSKWPSH